MVFYGDIEEFAKCGEYLTINKKKYAVVNKIGGGGTCYGLMEIINNDYSSKFIYQWQFKIKRLNYYCNVPQWTIGICSDNANYLNNDYSQSNYNWHVALSNLGVLHRTLFVRTKYDDAEGQYYEYYAKDYTYDYNMSICYNNNDVITINLDMKEKKMEYVINERNVDRWAIKQIPIFFPSADTKYRIAIFSEERGTKVKLINFDKIVWTRPKNETETIRDRIARWKHERE